MQKDWKLMTLFIGAIDDLISCAEDSSGATKLFAKIWNATLADIHDKFPRTVVQVVNEMELARFVFNASSDDAHCIKQYENLNRTLPCCSFPGNSDGCDRIQKQSEQWNDVLNTLAAEWEAKKLPEFRVITNPILQRNIVLGNEVSAYDCFHPNLLNNQNLAINMWNNLFTPAEKKLTAIDRHAALYCPTADDFLK